MSRRKLWVPVVLGAGSFIGTVVYRRRSVRTRTRLDVYFEDGSMVSIADGSPEAEPMLGLARDLLAFAG